MSDEKTLDRFEQLVERLEQAIVGHFSKEQEREIEIAFEEGYDKGRKAGKKYNY